MARLHPCTPVDIARGSPCERTNGAHWPVWPVIRANPRSTSAAWLNCSSPDRPILLVVTEEASDITVLAVTPEAATAADVLSGATGSVFFKAPRISTS